MFKWTYKYLLQVDLPLKEVWDFHCDPTNWSKWDNQLDTCFLVGEFKAGTQIKAKIKNKSTHLLIIIAEVKPYQNIKHCLMYLSVFRFDAYIFSLLTPFMKTTFLKIIEDARLKCREVYTEISAKKEIPISSI